VTWPFPEPLAPGPTVIQLALLAAVQVHPAAALTVTAPLAPVAGTDCEEGETVKLHMPSWVILTIFPAARM
jgi:hypothetical protein